MCTCPYMYPFMALPVHVHTFIPINRRDLPANISTALHVHRDAPVHQYTCSVYVFLFGITCTVTFPLICWSMYTQILMRFLCLRTKTYLSPQLLVYLPWNVTIHGPTCSFSYFYSIRLKAKICPSTFLLLYMSTDISVHHYTCTVYFFLFGITGTVTLPLIC